MSSNPNRELFLEAAKKVMETHHDTFKRLAISEEQDKMSGGKKNDGDKPQLDLIPYTALEETSRAFMYGANKYGRWNYKKGLAHSRLINAALRHINQYKEGEDLDPESGNSHLAHAMASLAMLIDGVKNHPELDDRFKKETT